MRFGEQPFVVTLFVVPDWGSDGVISGVLVMFYSNTDDLLINLCNIPFSSQSLYNKQTTLFDSYRFYRP